MLAALEAIAEAEKAAVMEAAFANGEIDLNARARAMAWGSIVATLKEARAEAVNEWNGHGEPERD